MSKERFYACNECGAIIGAISEIECPIFCGDKEMKPLIPNTTDAAGEKHVPVVETQANKVIVKVGSVEHPMTDEHSIQWIYLETKKGGQRRALTPADKPFAEFLLTEGDEAVAVYEYCNLHGLWKTEIK